MNPLYTFIGGAVVGYLLAFFKFIFDAEKSRFDFKAKVLQELWQEVLEVRSIAANMDPKGRLPQDGPPSEEQIQEDYQAIVEQEKKAAQVVRGNEPLYPAAIHDLARQLLSESMVLANYIVDPKSRGSNDYWGNNARMTKTVNDLRDQLAKAIRVEMNRPSINPFVK